ncbi:four helix bundle protein [Salinivirga cyanobacteriivorans]|uniref:Four helix bundle protein n=1 Tax=Salinivirga cyanobacteriivorans TaxID=1307839 RepID=A0A0S2I3Z8_9BACT|nr:four helix bundle protein [Salinivirga cyanobacteriivorans]ALO17062.1 four helix bundle protein [Salinivirga cyanobacteriivorans]
MKELSNWVQYKIGTRDRLKVFALTILEISEVLPKSTRANVINYQLTKSGTSIYANYRAALRGRSKKEFYSKLCIAVEEADETEMWLELLLSANISNKDIVKDAHKNSIEIVKVLANMRKRMEGKD